MIFSSKLLNNFSLSAIYSFLKYLRYRQTETSSGDGEIYNPGLDRLGATNFFDPLRSMFRSRPILWELLS